VDVLFPAILSQNAPSLVLPISRVFVYEYLSGGGTWSERDAAGPTGSLLREGCSMVSALAEDFQRLDQTEVVLLRDARLPAGTLPACQQVVIHDAAQERAAIAQLAAAADHSVLIAPEIDGALAERARWVEAAGGRLLSPSADFVRQATDKSLTARLLQARGLPTPRAIAVRPGVALPADFDYPAVLKPVDGAGSVGLQWITSPNDAYDPAVLGREARLEAYCPGLAASVAVLCGPAGNLPLPACRQWISDDGRFRYLGGEAPLDEARSRRAQELALAAIGSFPPAVGYVGVDLVLGAAADGRQDVVIEVNPRLTTSYIGLRQLIRTNLAAAMLAVAEGKPVDLPLARPHVTFSAG
jgi:predicted ATP-grasp superfamily ATP-dependent carboligase